MKSKYTVAVWLLVPLLVGCASRGPDEIVACGQRYHTGAPVVLWTDPGGYNAYLSPPGSHFNSRSDALTANPNLPLLQQTVDQFVLHYDVAGTSRQCFQTLQGRNLSVHFMLDLDGTIYQTMDLKERAWHATTSNTRSIGIEIANIGAYPSPNDPALREWYGVDSSGRVRITIPARFGDGGIRTPGFVGRPARPQILYGEVQGQVLYQYDLTPQQYDSLIKLTATLCKVFPQIRCDWPRVYQKLPDEVLRQYKGVLGHYHIQSNKTDPGPAIQWDWFLQQAR